MRYYGKQNGYNSSTDWTDVTIGDDGRLTITHSQGEVNQYPSHTEYIEEIIECFGEYGMPAWDADNCTSEWAVIRALYPSAWGMRGRMTVEHLGPDATEEHLEAYLDELEMLGFDTESLGGLGPNDDAYLTALHASCK